MTDSGFHENLHKGADRQLNWVLQDGEAFPSPEGKVRREYSRQRKKAMQRQEEIK